MTSMNTAAPRVYDESSWNTEYLLPQITEHPELLDYQLLLGGLSLVLSRLHPVFGRTKFISTRNLAMRLSRAVEYRDAQRAHLVSAEMRGALTECEKTLDPGSLLVFRKLLAKVIRQEVESREGEGMEYFTYSDFMAEDAMLTQKSGRGVTVHAM